MAQHERAQRQQQKNKVDEKHRARRQESQPSSDNLQALIGETPFRPQMEEHTGLLASAHSDEHLARVVLQLQQTYGNRYVTGLLKQRTAQAKLTVSSPGDVYEREADRVAEKVVRTVNSPVQRQEEEEPLQGKFTTIHRETVEEEEPLQGKLITQVQRQSEEEEIQTKLMRQEEEEEEAQTKLLSQRAAMNTVPEVTPDLEDKINTARTGGRPLDNSILSPMEQTFGADFNGIRVHTDAVADTLSQSLQARAFTTGKDIFFKSGEYNPGSTAGQLLLAHELTHTVQQGTAGILRPVQREIKLENNEEKKVEEPYKNKPLEGMDRTVFDQALAKFKQMGRSRIRGGLSKSMRRIEARKYLKEEVEASKKYPAYYIQQIINGIMVAYKDVFGEELGQEKATEKPDTKKSTREGTVPVNEPDKSPGPETYFTLVQNAKFIKASGGGTGGVFFLYPEKPVEGKKVNPDVVVKFEPGEAVRGKFAENLLVAGGFEVTRSLVSAVNSSQGKQVKSKIQSLVNSPQSSPQEDPAKGRLEQVFGKMNQGKAVIVSDFIPSLGTFAELMTSEQGKEERGVKNTPETEQALIDAFNNVENAVGLGKLLVFDAILGNQDRLDAMNLANVMLGKRGGKWTFVLIDNDAEVPTMLGALGPKLKQQAEDNGFGRPYKAEAKLTVKQWVKNLIEGGRGEAKETAGINFIGNAGKSAAEVMEKLKSKYLSQKGMENVMKAINLGMLQRGIMHGINEGANSILNINSKALKKMLEQETKSLGKTELLSAYGLELKWQYVHMVFEQKKKHEEAMAEIEAMASKKMKELTGNADFVIDEQTGYQQKGKINTK